MAKRSPQAGIVERIIKLGYDLPAQKGGHLFFLVGARASTKETDWIDIVNTMVKIDYNGFHGHEVSMVLAFLVDNGYLVMVEFGREYSPVLYLHPSKSFVDDIATGAARMRAVVAYFEGLFRNAGSAPEECVWEPRHQRLRLWWD